MTKPLGNMSTRARIRSARNTVDALLAADTLDQEAIDRLASREHYADIADALQQKLGSNSLVQAILGSPATFAPLRLALALGVYDPETRFPEAVTIQDLKAAASPRAKLALILLGEPFAWDNGDAMQRAAFALRQLVDRMRRTMQF